MNRLTLFCAAALALGSAAFAGELKDPLWAEAVSRHTYVLAEFVSKSCPVCRDMGPVAEAAVTRHIGIVHQIHDADRELELANKYEVRCVPVYVVVDPKGQVRFNDVGPRTAEEFDGIFKKAGVKRR